MNKGKIRQTTDRIYTNPYTTRNTFTWTRIAETHTVRLYMRMLIAYFNCADLYSLLYNRLRNIIRLCVRLLCGRKVFLPYSYLRLPTNIYKKRAAFLPEDRTPNS